MSVAALLIPDFALIAFGAWLRRSAGFSEVFWAQLEKLIYFVFFPALLFRAIVRAQIDLAATAGPLQSVVGATLLGMAAAFAARRLFRLAPMTFAAGFQCGFRFNSYIAFSVIGRLYGQDGIAAMAILQAVMIPIVNTAAVWALAHHGDARVWKELARNPLIIATVLGIVASFAGVPIPDALDHALALFAQPTVSLGLITIGAALRLESVQASRGAFAYLSAVKLIAVPLTAYGIGRAIGLAPLPFHTAVVFAALPTATSAYILAARMGGDKRFVAALIAVQTLAAMVTLSFWLTAIGI